MHKEAEQLNPNSDRQGIENFLIPKIMRQLLSLCFLLSPTLWAASTLPPLPFIQSQYQHLPNSQAIQAYLHKLSEHNPHARVYTLGYSAGKRPIQGLFISNDASFLKSGQPSSNKLSVLLIGSQHGTEPSGAEAIQALAYSLLAHPQNPLLNVLNFILIPNGNPDGRDLQLRGNARHENSNIDYTRLSTPEAQTYVRVLHQYHPDVVFDLHESSVEKNILTKKQGYITTVQAQYEVATNPNVSPALHRYANKHFLPKLMAKTQAKGLPATRYTGELFSIHQPIAHGGLRITNLRNYSGLQGSLSVLVENRLDRKHGIYPSPKNIAARIQKQTLSINAFLETLVEEKQSILQVTRKQPTRKSAVLRFAYTLNRYKPQIQLPLEDIHTQHIKNLRFRNYDTVSVMKTNRLPRAYVILPTAASSIQPVLDRHFISYQRFKKTHTLLAMLPKIDHIGIQHPLNPRFRIILMPNVQYHLKHMEIPAGSLYVSCDNNQGLLTTLLLDPESIDSVYQSTPYKNELLKLPYMDIFPVA